MKNKMSPHLYYFFRRNIGAHFQVQANGEFPIDEAAALLAIHCLKRGLLPADYVLMTEAAPDILDGLNAKAEKLLEVSRTVNAIKLTRREEQVLDGVIHVKANKEIAALLNLSERTVKFHVSSLLAKFGVRGRMELIREQTIPLQLAAGGRS